MSAGGQARGRHVVSPRFDSLGLDGKPCRLGIFGGTFDPIHVGHLAAAEAARSAFGLDAVMFMPSGTPPFKEGTVVASPADRLAMCELAVRESGNPAFDVSSMEVRREGATYTIDTLRALRAHYPSNVELAFILGVDALATLLDWRAPDDLARLASFIALSRPGYRLDDAMRAELAEAGFRVLELDGVEVDVSSSSVRDQMGRGCAPAGEVPQAVRHYIAQHGLYQGPAGREEAR